MLSKEILSSAGIKGGNQDKHQWTDEERAIVRRDYKGTNASAAEIAARLGVSLWGVKGQAAKLGILQQKSPPWTPEEVEQLKELIHRYPVGVIARRLHRSANAVKIKATRLKLQLRLRDNWFTKKDVSEICGVDHKKIQQWIDSGALKATWHYGKKPSKEGMSSWHIEAVDLKKFLIEYCGELLGRNVDIQQIVYLLIDEPKICKHPKWIINGENIGTCANPECGEVRRFPLAAGERIVVLKKSKCNSRIAERRAYEAM
jgi:hypothetical protein